MVKYAEKVARKNHFLVRKKEQLKQKRKGCGSEKKNSDNNYDYTNNMKK